MLKNVSLMMCVGALGLGAGLSPAAAFERSYPVATSPPVYAGQPAPTQIAYA